MNREQIMEKLFDKLAERLLQRLDDDDIKPADLNVIRQFLKDNGIEADPTENEDVKSLVEGLNDLPEFGEGSNNVVNLR